MALLLEYADNDSFDSNLNNEEEFVDSQLNLLTNNPSSNIVDKIISYFTKNGESNLKKLFYLK